MQPDRTSVSFAILGRPFAARNASAHLEEWLRAYWDYPELAVPPHPYAIELEAVATAPTGARDRWTAKEVSIPGRTLSFRNAGRMWETGDAGAGLRLELRDDASRFELW
jgi:hypothetical protein